MLRQFLITKIASSVFDHVKWIESKLQKFVFAIFRRFDIFALETIVSMLLVCSSETLRFFCSFLGVHLATKLLVKFFTKSTSLSYLLANQDDDNQHLQFCFSEKRRKKRTSPTNKSASRGFASTFFHPTINFVLNLDH